MHPVPFVALIVLALAAGAVLVRRHREGRLTRVRDAWGTRNALALLRIHGAPDTLHARAMTTAASLARQRGLTPLSR